jgi:PAS domain S-box-containing protein
MMAANMKGVGENAALLWRENEQRFREMIDALPAAIYTTDADGRLTHFNPAAVRLSGRVPELGTDQWCVTWKILLPDGTHVPHDQCPMAAALKGLPVDTGGEYMAERPDGSRFWFSPYPTALRDSEGRITGGINMLVDITERKRTDAALRQSEERFRGLFESSGVGIAVLTLEGRFLQANQAFCSIVGYSEEELRSLDYIRLTHASDSTAIQDLIARVTTGALPNLTTENRYLTKDGRAVWVNGSFSLIRDAHGRPEYLIALCEDITARKQMEVGLSETQERLRAIIETTPECVKLVARDGTLLNMNSAGLAMIGADRPEDAIGKNVYDLIAPDFRDSFRDFNERVCNGEKGSLEFDIIGLKGRRRHMEAHSAPLRRPDGSVVQLAITHDITDRARRERAALLLGAIVDSSDDAIISKDLNGIITSWNKSAERVFGYTADEAVGKSITILIPEDRLDEERLILSRLRRGERVDHFETIRHRKDGTLLNISLTISPVKNADGKIIGASKIARDITDRKRAEAALLASEARFRQLADSMPQMVWTARADGYLDYFNERWYEFTGFSRDQFGDSSWKPILHPDDVDRCYEAWSESVHAGRPYRIEYRFWDRHENRWRWFMTRALPVRGDDGAVVKWFGTCTDIDEQKKVEDELVRANQDLEQFAYSASHDLQEPLRTIKIYGELLHRRHVDKLDGQALEFLEYLHSGATRMEFLVRDLLAYTQAGRLDAPAGQTDANEAFTATIEDLDGAISQSGATVTCDRLPAVRVHGTHLKQLFQNLIGNAIKYRSKERAPVVHVTAEARNDSCIFSVRDNGIGISPEYREQIFGLFKRLHSGDEYSGTGIGLAICQRIVERYHGRIWVESEPGNGSTFRFALPA